jgi:hypothetical protein
VCSQQDLLRSTVEDTVKEHLTHWGDLQKSGVTDRQIYEAVIKSHKPGTEEFPGTRKAPIVLEL